MSEFDRWWGASEYCQVVINTCADRQIAMDAWNAAFASRPDPAPVASALEQLSESDKDVALGQAVEFAQYVSDHARGEMVKAADRFLAMPYSQEIAARLKPAPMGVRVPDAIDAEPVNTQHYADGWNDCREETLAMNPQPGAVVSEQRRADFINGYKAGAADYSVHGINHAELANDAIQSADHEGYTLTNTDKGVGT